MKAQLALFISTLALTAVLVANAESPVTTPVPVSPASLAIVNTSAPAANASIVTVMPPQTLETPSILSNITFASVGLDIAAAASQFNASIPLEAVNSTIAPLKTVNASVASLLPANATQVINKNDNSTLLVADPSWGKAIVVNASSLDSTKLVVSNATDLGGTTVFTTVYNTTTVCTTWSSQFAGSFGLL